MGLEAVTRKVERPRVMVFNSGSSNRDEGGDVSYNSFSIKDTTLANSVAKMREKKRGNIFGFISLAALIGGLGYCGWHEYDIKSRLDENSAYCNPINNLMPDEAIKRFFPKGYVYEKNKDIENDGIFESIEVYADSSGRWVYTEFSKDGSKGKPAEF